MSQRRDDLESPDIPHVSKGDLTSPEPAYDLEVERRPGYVRFYIRACETPPAVARTIIRRIREGVMNEHTGRVMIESQIARPETEGNIRTIMNNLIEMLGGYRVAFVNLNTEQGSEWTFATQVGREGGEDHRYFTSTEPAENWLLGWE